MADENEEQNEAPAAAGPGWLVAILMGIAGLGGGFGGSMAIMPNNVSATPAATEEAAEATPEAAFSERVETLDPFVVNVSGEGYPRYLKLQIALEMDSAEAKAALKDRVPQVRDLTILLLSSKRLGDITDFEGKALLKDDLRERINTLMPKGTVRNVMFTEFVVQ